MREEYLIGTDFDGTVTDDEAGIPPFRDSYLDDFSRRLQMGRNMLEEMFSSAETIVAAGEAGQEDSGIVMSPMGVYSKITRATRLVLRQLRNDSRVMQSLLPSSEDSEEALLNDLYRKNYPNAATVFRPYAREYLEELNAVSRLVIITNSEANAVLARLRLLKGAPDVPVFGGAKKKKGDPDGKLSHVNPASIMVDGLSRPIYVRRAFYHEVLKQTGALDMPPERVVVAGDNLELDLILPWALRMGVALLDKGEERRAYEAAFLRTQERAVSGFTLEELVRGIREKLLR